MRTFSFTISAVSAVCSVRILRIYVDEASVLAWKKMAQPIGVGASSRITKTLAQNESCRSSGAFRHQPVFCCGMSDQKMPRVSFNGLRCIVGQSCLASSQAHKGMRAAAKAVSALAVHLSSRAETLQAKPRLVPERRIAPLPIAASGRTALA